jgi:hypothetical protein
MAKSRSGHRPGGGIKSRVNVEPGYRHGQQKKRTIPAGVAQIGQRQGNHPTNKDATSYGGVSLFGGTGYPSKLGNRAAAETKAGPGGSREVMPSGSQCMTGPANSGQPMRPTKPLFPGWEK